MKEALDKKITKSWGNDEIKWLSVEDVREAVRELKEDLHCIKRFNVDEELTESHLFGMMSMQDVENVINKIFGILADDNSYFAQKLHSVT